MLRKKGVSFEKQDFCLVCQNFVLFCLDVEHLQKTLSVEKLNKTPKSAFFLIVENFEDGATHKVHTLKIPHFFRHLKAEYVHKSFKLIQM